MSLHEAEKRRSGRKGSDDDAGGSDGDVRPPIGALALDLVVIGYSLTVADAFE